jgi:hypothetical protein
MIIGAHMIIYSTDPDLDRAFIRDVLKFPFVDSGEGWLIFRLPAAEMAVHPAEQNDHQELYLMCADIDALIVEMKSLMVKCSEVEELSWGRLTRFKLPGGGQMGVYQAKHARP